jgi:hypothetical protein
MTVMSGENQAVGNWTTLSETMQPDQRAKGASAGAAPIEKWAKVLRPLGQSSEILGGKRHQGGHPAPWSIGLVAVGTIEITLWVPYRTAIFLRGGRYSEIWWPDV